MRAPFFVFEGEDGASAPAGGEPPAAAAASKKSKTFGKRLSTNFSAAPGKGLTGLTEPDFMPGLETGERTLAGGNGQYQRAWAQQKRAARRMSHPGGDRGDGRNIANLIQLHLQEL